ncbi:MAG TPA: DUF1553 domain-containing protein, partial [Tepidisphaeraceae bacterium]|nr:DUF1553 domain-containing protein [Tepidisphaeraceae bacterium]
ALFLMNNPFVLDKSLALARRMLHEALPEDRARINWLYETLYSRPASDKEISIGLSLLRSMGPGTPTEATWQPYCQVLLCANEFVYID